MGRVEGARRVLKSCLQATDNFTSNTRAQDICYVLPAFILRYCFHKNSAGYPTHPSSPYVTVGSYFVVLTSTPTAVDMYVWNTKESQLSLGANPFSWEGKHYHQNETNINYLQLRPLRAFAISYIIRLLDYQRADYSYDIYRDNPWLVSRMID